MPRGPPRDNPANFLDGDQRWHELHRCLTDDGLSLPARVAGALLFLYGLQPSRLVTLKADNVQQRRTGAYLKIGNGRLPLPPALATLVTDLLDQRRSATLPICNFAHIQLQPLVEPQPSQT